MSRTLKRVPLEFSWPLREVWEGYLNPFVQHSKPCQACAGSGMTAEAKFLDDSWYPHKAREMFGILYGHNTLSAWSRERLKSAGHPEKIADHVELARRFGFATLTHWEDKLDEGDVRALFEAERINSFTHTWSVLDRRWVPKNPVELPTPDEVNRAFGTPVGHDTMSRIACVRARWKRYGIKPECLPCLGTGSVWPSPELERKCDEWQEYEPPTGPGWQIWDRIGMGSPLTPVFRTPGELATYCAENSTFGSNRLSREQILRILRDEDPDAVDAATMNVVAGGGAFGIAAEFEMGPASPKDWTPEERRST